MKPLSPETFAQRKSEAPGPDSLLIACYCAAWCDTCRAYETPFAELAEAWPQHVFLWIDIEDHPELLGDEDVEDFPTILIQSQQGNLFFGAQPPHISHLDRLVKSMSGASAALPGGPPPLAPLLNRE